jgi:hypothetical protein
MVEGKGFNSRALNCRQLKGLDVADRGKTWQGTRQDAPILCRAWCPPFYRGSDNEQGDESIGRWYRPDAERELLYDLGPIAARHGLPQHHAQPVVSGQAADKTAGGPHSGLVTV